ncbi:hypothetical protein ACFL11_01035 [Patescibacteria group bacterium]
MEREEVLAILGEVGAIVVGDHFVYTSGKHGNAYVNKDSVFPYTRLVSRLCKVIAHHFWGTGVDVVVGPTVGGVALAQWTAHHCSFHPHKPQILAVYVDEKDGKRVFLRGYDQFLIGGCW